MPVDTPKKSGRTKRILYVLSVNVVVFVLLLITANFMAGLVIDFRLDKLFDEDNRASLPNYADKDRAKLIFDEFNSLSGEYRAYMGWSREEFRGETVTINAEGDREHPATTDSPTGVVRFFGGSTMWGTGAEDEGTIPAHFNALFPNYRVYNHAQAGFLSRQSLARLVNLALQDEPMDLVVFYDGVNLVQYHCNANVPPNRHARAERIADLVGRSRMGSMFYGNLLEVAAALESKFRALMKSTGDRASLCERDSDYARQVARKLIESWKAARAIVDAKGGRFMAVLQPVIYVGDPRRDHLGISLTTRRARSYRAVYPHLQSMVAELGEDWAYDLTAAFDGNELIYIDFCHVSENGNRLIAERLAGILAPEPSS